jgi:hypothetical protein
MTENLYGFTTSDDVQLDSQGLPVGTHKVMIVGEEAAKNDAGVVAEYEILEGDHKGSRGKVWYLTKHENQQTSNIAKSNLKRIADASGKALTPEVPLKGRVLTVKVRQQKKNPQYTEVEKYLPEDYREEIQVPE